jgi:predicted O-methyltransferase YrrM
MESFNDIKDYEKYLTTDNWFNYSQFYERVAKRKDFNIFVEVGVWKGHSITYLANQLIKNNRTDAKVYAVDLWDETYKYDGVNHGDKHLNEQVKYLYDIYNTNVIRAGVRDIITDIKQYSWSAASNFEDGSVDFVFIDAGHEHEEVTKDIKAWLPKIKKGGMLSGHDWGQVSPAVRAFFDDERINIVGPCWTINI